MKKLFLFAITTFFLTPSFAKVLTKTIEYKEGDIILEGLVAYDDAKKGKRPGVMVVPAWRGPNEYSKSRAEQLAKMGYVAFVADVYGKGIRPSVAEAGKVSGEYKKNRPLFRKRVNAALEELKKQSHVDTKKVAAIGYCFGGTGVLELARSGADLLGVVSFHGGLDSPTPADGKNIKAKVLVLHGADDPYVKETDIKGFESEMRAGNVDWQLVKYSKAVHAFTEPGAGNDPSTGVAYNELADQRSWIAMQDFFKEIFAQK